MGEPRACRETICSSCTHCLVCQYKNDYMDTLHKLENVFYGIPKENRDGFDFKDPGCKWHEKKLQVNTFGPGVTIRGAEKMVADQAEHLRRTVK